MRCFSCEEMLGNKPFHDKETGRFYCEACREIIWGIIMDANEKDDPKPKALEPGEIETIEEDFDEDYFEDATEDSFADYNLPEGEDY